MRLDKEISVDMNDSVMRDMREKYEIEDGCTKEDDMKQKLKQAHNTLCEVVEKSQNLRVKYLQDLASAYVAKKTRQWNKMYGNCCYMKRTERFGQ